MHDRYCIMCKDRRICIMHTCIYIHICIYTCHVTNVPRRYGVCTCAATIYVYTACIPATKHVYAACIHVQQRNTYMLRVSCCTSCCMHDMCCVYHAVQQDTYTKL